MLWKIWKCLKAAGVEAFSDFVFLQYFIIRLSQLNDWKMIDHRFNFNMRNDLVFSWS